MPLRLYLGTRRDSNSWAKREATESQYYEAEISISDMVLRATERKVRSPIVINWTSSQLCNERGAAYVNLRVYVIPGRVSSKHYVKLEIIFSLLCCFVLGRGSTLEKHARIASPHIPLQSDHARDGHEIRNFSEHFG